jgi:nicotinamidase-related amidase
MQHEEAAVLHGADLGYIPVIVKDACAFGHRDAADRSVASLEFAVMLCLQTRIHSAVLSLGA